MWDIDTAMIRARASALTHPTDVPADAGWQEVAEAAQAVSGRPYASVRTMASASTLRRLAEAAAGAS